MNLIEIGRWLGYLTIPAAAILLARFLWIGGARRYWCLLSYLLADILQTLLAGGASISSLWYGYIYFGGEAVKTVLAICLSIQLWLLALHAYPGLARFGRRIALYTLLAALIVAAAGLWLQPSVRAGQGVFPHIFNAFQGVLDSMAALFLVVAAIFLLWFPVEVTHNVASLTGGIVLWLLTQWAALLLINFHPQAAHETSVILLCVNLGCLIFWNFAIRRSGENLTTVTGHRWNPDEAERLVGQLDAINARLERAAG